MFVVMNNVPASHPGSRANSGGGGGGGGGVMADLCLSTSLKAKNSVRLQGRIYRSPCKRGVLLYCCGKLATPNHTHFPLLSWQKGGSSDFLNIRRTPLDPPLRLIPSILKMNPLPTHAFLLPRKINQKHNYSQALQPSRNFCETIRNKTFLKISLQKFRNNTNLKKFKLFNYKADKNAVFLWILYRSPLHIVS